MKPEDARKYADEVARMDNHFSETLIIVDVEVRDEIAATIRTLADQLDYTMRHVEALKTHLRNARDTLRDIASDADIASDVVSRAESNGGAK